MSHQLFDHIHRQVVCPVLATGLSKRVNRQLAHGFYACPLVVAPKVSQDVVDHIAIQPRLPYLPELLPFGFYLFVPLFT